MDWTWKGETTSIQCKSCHAGCQAHGCMLAWREEVRNQVEVLLSWPAMPAVGVSSCPCFGDALQDLAPHKAVRGPCGSAHRHCGGRGADNKEAGRAHRPVHGAHAAASPSDKVMQGGHLSSPIGSVACLWPLRSASGLPMPSAGVAVQRGQLESTLGEVAACAFNLEKCMRAYLVMPYAHATCGQMCVPLLQHGT